MQVAVVVVVFLFPLAAQRCATTLFQCMVASMPCPLRINLQSAIMTSCEHLCRSILYGTSCHLLYLVLCGQRSCILA